MTKTFYFLGDTCKVKDSDACIQEAWGSSYKCSTASKGYCTSYAKDMRRCCPDSCETGPLTEEACNNLKSTSGTCTYPNDAQCEIEGCYIINI